MLKNTQVKDLLYALREQNESELSLNTVVKGRAVSKYEGAIHVVTAAGTISIPIEEIESVYSDNNDLCDVVLEVRNRSSIKMLQRNENAALRNTPFGTFGSQNVFGGVFSGIETITFCTTSAETATDGPTNDASDITDEQLCDAG